MARLILHVGTSKAGSTAVQEFLAANRRAFAAAGLDYFPALDRPNHAELAAAFCTESNRPAAALGVRTAADRERLRGWLARRVTRRLRPDATWLASSEHLSALLVRAEEVAALAAYLRGFFDQVLVLVVLRRADFFLPSSYVESVRAGGTHRLDAAFVTRRAPVLDHARLLGRWSQAFGPGAVRAVPFLESDKRAPQALPHRLLEAVGVDLGDLGGYAAPPALRNEGIGGYATEVLRRANPVLRTSALRPLAGRRRAVAAIAGRWPGPSLALTPEAHQALDRAGWTDPGVGRTPYAAGPGWPQWSAQPPAPVAPQPAIPDAEWPAVLATLRELGVVRDRSGPTGPLREAAAGQLRRAVRLASRLR